MMQNEIENYVDALNANTRGHLFIMVHRLIQLQCDG